MTDTTNLDGYKAVAAVLLAAVTATSGALAFFGADSDRIWLMLDEGDSRRFLIFAAIATFTAIALALASYLIPRGKPLALGLGVTAYVLALFCAVWAATLAADAATRPSIVDFNVAKEGDERIVTLEVAGTSVDEDDRIGVAVRDVRAASNEYLLRSYPGTTAGEAVLKVRFPVPADARKLEAMVWTFETGGQSRPACSKEEAAASVQPNDDEAVVLVDCLHLVVPESPGPRANAQAATD